MQDLEDRLKELGDRVSVEAPSELRPTPRALRRIRVGRAVRSGAVLATVAAVAIGGLAGALSLSRDDAAPLPPADERKQEIEPTRTGRIITSVNGRQEWQAYDQDTGLFFFYSYVTERASVISQDGRVAEFDCPPSADCEFAPTFGPGPDELTVPTYVPQSSWDLRSVQVIGFDGKVRDTLEMPDDIQDRRITDLAWSPDRSRLAISLEPDCDTCEGKVWIVERDGGEPQVVFTEPAPAEVGALYENGTVLGELAWSPDGRSLTLLVASFLPEGLDDEALYASNDVWPRLVALRLQPGHPVHAETLHVYDDVIIPEWNIAWEWRFYFASAWSPDGTRIAVTSKGGIAEISAENGDVLARHRVNPSLAPGAASPGMEGGYGLLAWLPKQ